MRHAALERGAEGFRALTFSGAQGVEYPSAESEESKILESVRSCMTNGATTATPFAAIVIEPTRQSTGHSVSDGFIDKLSGIAEDFDAALVVDETGSGCGASGSGFWQYKGHKADYVVFGKRM